MEKNYTFLFEFLIQIRNNGCAGQVLQQKLDYYEGSGGLIWQLQEALQMRARQAAGRIAELEAQIRQRDGLLRAWEAQFAANKTAPKRNVRKEDQGVERRPPRTRHAAPGLLVSEHPSAREPLRRQTA